MNPVHLLLQLPITVKLGQTLLNCRSDVSADNATSRAHYSKPSQQPDNAHSADRPTRLRFDHGNLQGFYDCTRVLLPPILNDLNDDLNMHNNIYEEKQDKNRLTALIENSYCRVVNALNNASKSFIPNVKRGVFKNWWDRDLEDLKQKAMSSHKMWLDCGKPRCGDIFNLRNHEKYSSKSEILKRKLLDKKNVSNELQYYILEKDSTIFWKTWKRKVCLSTIKSPCIDGCFR